MLPAQAAYARRGAPWTFDAQAFVAAVRRIRQNGKALLPSFDHGLGDPVEDDIVIDAAQHSVVLVSACAMQVANAALQVAQSANPCHFCCGWVCRRHMCASQQHAHHDQASGGTCTLQSGQQSLSSTHCTHKRVTFPHVLCH